MKVLLDAMAHIPHISVGDHAMIWGIANTLRRRFKDAEITFLCKYPEHERIYLERMDFHFKTVPRSHNKLIAARQFRKLAEESDLVVSAWGDGFITNPPHQAARKVYCMKTKRSKLALCSTSIGPFSPMGFRRKQIKAALGKYDYLSVRDTISHRYIQELGLDNVEMIPDGAYALKPCPGDRVDEILEHHQMPKGAPFVGFNLGVEFMAFCENSGIDYIKVCIAAIERIRSVCKCSVLMIPHQYLLEQYDYGPIAGITYDQCDDRYPIDRLWESLGSRERIYRLDKVYDCSELKGIIGRSEIFLCQRIHPSVASTSLCVPTAIMHYTHKAKGMMDLLGKGDYVWYAKDLPNEGKQDTSTKRLLDMIDQLWGERNQYRDDLQSIIPDMINRAFSLGDRVADIIDR